jgi:hypothetical protein
LTEFVSGHEPQSTAYFVVVQVFVVA